MEHYIAWALLTLVSAFVGSYLAAYFRKKAENLATHEDIAKLADQVRIVTTTAKEIEAKISNEVWDRQKQWELKRDVLFEGSKRLAEVDDALLSYNVPLNLKSKLDAERWAKETNERAARWLHASEALDETRLLVSIICTKETIYAFDSFDLFTKGIAKGIGQENPDVYDKSRKELSTKLFAVKDAIRKELGVVETLAK